MRYTTKRNISLIISLIFLIGALAVFFMFVLPILKDIRELNKKLAQEKKHYEVQLQAVQTAKSIINRYRSNLSFAQDVSTALPRDPDIQNLIKQLEIISQESNIEIKDLSFEKIASLPISEEGELVQPYQTLIINLNLLGTYEDFKTWLSAVEANRRLMDVNKITLGGGGVEGVEKLNFNVGLSVYYQ